MFCSMAGLYTFFFHGKRLFLPLDEKCTSHIYSFMSANLAVSVQSVAHSHYTPPLSFENEDLTELQGVLEVLRAHFKPTWMSRLKRFFKRKETTQEVRTAWATLQLYKNSFVRHLKQKHCGLHTPESLLVLHAGRLSPRLQDMEQTPQAALFSVEKVVHLLKQLGTSNAKNREKYVQSTLRSKLAAREEEVILDILGVLKKEIGALGKDTKWKEKEALVGKCNRTIDSLLGEVIRRAHFQDFYVDRKPHLVPVERNGEVVNEEGHETYTFYDKRGRKVDDRGEIIQALHDISPLTAQAMSETLESLDERLTKIAESPVVTSSKPIFLIPRGEKKATEASRA